MQTIWRATLSGVKLVLVAFMTGIVLCTAWGVITRYMLNDASAWTGELSTYMLIWITFLGSALAVVEGGHMNFDLILEKLPPVPKKAALLIGNLALLYFVGVLTYYGAVVTVSTMSDHALTIPVSKMVFYAALPVSGAIMLVGYLINTVKLFVTAKSGNSKIEPVEEHENDKQGVVV